LHHWTSKLHEKMLGTLRLKTSLEASNSLTSLQVQHSSKHSFSTHRTRSSLSSRLLSNVDSSDASSRAVTEDNYSVTSHPSELNDKPQAVLKKDNVEQLNDLSHHFTLCGFPILIFNVNGSIQWMNHELEELLGMLLFSVTGSHYSHLFTEKSYFEMHRLITEFIMGENHECYERLEEHEKKKRKKDLSTKRLTLQLKSIVWKRVVTVECRVIYLKKHGVGHFVWYMKEMEGEGTQPIALYESITEQCVNPIVSISEEGIVQTFNKAAVSVFGYSPQDVLGRNVNKLCHRSVMKKHDYYINRYITTGEKRVIDSVRVVKGRHKNGSTLKLELRVSEIKTENIRSFVAFIRDMESQLTKDELLTQIADQIFPKGLAQRLSMGQQVIDKIHTISLMYCDIVGFTEMSFGKSPENLVILLHEIFGRFDDICGEHRLEKIATIGDCYCCVSGIPKYTKEHAVNIVKAAVTMIQSVKHLGKEDAAFQNIQVRIGIHSCDDVMGAVMGRVKQNYDLFGTGTYVAQLMEETGKANQIHISNSCYNELQNTSLRNMFTPHYETGDEVYLEKKGMKSIPTSTWITNSN